MTFSPALFAELCRHGLLLAGAVLARDNLQLSPAFISKAAALRLRTGLRALAAYLRRVLLLMALSLEAGLPRETAPRVIYARAPRTGRAWPLFRVFVGERDVPDDLRDCARQSPTISPPPGSVQAAPLLARWSALKALLEAPEARARRLAFHLARRRPGFLLAPDAGNLRLARRFGTEVSALYAGLGPAILTASRARPPPLGPLPRAGPRIRRL